MSVYFAPLMNMVRAGISNAVEAFSSSSPWARAVSIVTALAIPLLCKSRKRSSPPNPINTSPVSGIALSSPPILIHTWNVGDKQVKLYRKGNDLQAESTAFPGKINSIPIPNGWSIEQVINNLIILTPIIQAEGTILFTSRHECQIGGGDVAYVDNNNWAIRLVDTGNCGIDPTSWGGHAVIYVEGVDNGKRFIRSFDLVSDSTTKDRANVREYVNTDNFNYIKNRFQGMSEETWVRTKTQVLKMIQAIDGERLKQKRENKAHILFDPRGSDVEGPITALTGRSAEDIPDNCITWARKKLALASVHLPVCTDVALGMATTPKDYIKPMSYFPNFLNR